MTEQIDQCTYGNAYTGALEVFQFTMNPPLNVFCYPGDEGKSATTWTGERLDKGGLHFGKEWRDNFGGTRESISFVGRNGYWYHGTTYSGNGHYIRAKRGKLAKAGA